MVRIFTNLSLHGTTPLRAQPQVGEWGPSSVQSTRRKRLNRWLWVSALVIVIAALFVFGYNAYDMIMSAGS